MPESTATNAVSYTTPRDTTRNSILRTLPRAFLDAARFADAVLFWPVLAGRDPSLLDGTTNGAGVIAGVLVARSVLASLRVRRGYDRDRPSGTTRR